MADNKLYKRSIAMAAVIASVTCGMTAPAFADGTTPADGNTVVTAPADPGKTGTETPAASDVVAKIGDTEYKTLDEALTAAKDGDTVQLTGAFTGTATISKKITLQGVTGNKVTGRIIVAAAGATVKGVNFVFDASTPDMFQTDTKTGYTFNGKDDRRGAAFSQLTVDNASDVTVEGNTFTIDKTANPTLQLNAVRILGDKAGAKNVTVNGNTFTIANGTRYLTDKTPNGTDSWSRVAVNIHGSSADGKTANVKDLKITNNTLTATAGDWIAADKLPEAAVKDGKKPVAQVNYVVANGNSDKAAGVDGIAFTGNTAVSKSGLADKDSQLYGLTLMGTANVTATKNTFAGYVAVATSKWGTQTGNTGLSYQDNTDNTTLGVSFAKGSYTGAVDYKNNSGTNSSAQLVSTGDASYLTLQEALDASKDGKLTLQGDIKSDPVIIPEGKTVAIDLNGHTLTADLTNEGELTVSDSTEAGKLVGKIDGKGKLTLTGGTFQFEPAEGTVPAGYAVVANEKDKTYTVVALKLDVTNNDVTYDVKSGELDADKVIALTGATAPTGYEVIVPEEALTELNDAIKAGVKKDLTVNLQLGKDGKPVDGIDPVAVNFHVVSTNIEVNITVRSGELTVNAGDGQYTAAQLLEKAGASATEGADLQVNVDQLNKLNDAIAANKAGDYTVGLTAVKDGVTAVSPLVVHVQAATLTANGFDWNVNDGELTVDKVLDLAKPVVSGSDYKLDVNADQLAELNKAIKDGKTGKVTITITATGTGRPQLVAALDVDLTTKKVDTATGKLAQTGSTFLTVLATSGLLAAMAFGLTAVRRRISSNK